MTSKKKNRFVSGDPQKKTMVNSVLMSKRESDNLCHFLDEFLDTEISTRASELADAFMRSRTTSSTHNEEEMIKRYFILAMAYANAMSFLDQNRMINFDKIAIISQIDHELKVDIECWLAKKGL